MHNPTNIKSTSLSIGTSPPDYEEGIISYFCFVFFVNENIYSFRIYNYSFLLQERLSMRMYLY